MPHRSQVAWRGQHRAPVAALDHQRQVAGVVEVGVGQHDQVQFGRIDRRRIPVAQPQFLQSLEQAAVDQQAETVVLDEELRAGDGPGGAVETKAWTSTLREFDLRTRATPEMLSQRRRAVRRAEPVRAVRFGRPLVLG